MPKLVDELEQFEEELKKSRESDEDEGSHDLLDADGSDEGEEEIPPKEEEPAESGQKAEDSETDLDAEEETASQDKEEPAPRKKLTTLPNDPDTFGEWAGKEITEEELVKSGLLPKLVTWGHQGRHLVQKTQAELEKAKAEKSEAQKLRELLEEQFKKENERKEVEQRPSVSDEEFAAALANEYLPGLKQVAEKGGFEKEFLSDFPNLACQLEHRFQSGGSLIAALAKEVTEIREFVGMQKKRIEEEEVQKKQTSATQTFASTVANVAKEGGDLFEPLSSVEVQKDFVNWITRPDSHLLIADKDIGDITAEDVEGAWLLYVHKHPNVVKPKKKAPESHLAGGGGGGGGSNASKSKSKKQEADELATFEAELRAAEKRKFED